MVKKNKLTFHLVTSKKFWCGTPLVISEIVKRGHYISCFDENNLPDNKILLNCDVFIDMSTITDESFYTSLKNYLAKSDIKPLMVDPPEAILNSVDKRKTYVIFPDLIPESYNLDGKNNSNVLNKFLDDKHVVVKPAIGWWAKSVELLSPNQTIKKYASSDDVIVQKYVPFENGVGRIVTINHKDNFKIACSYIRKPKSWKTGVDIKHTCIEYPVNKKLYDFAKQVSQRCGLYLNGIDYIYNNGRYVLIEVNAVPAMKEPYDEFKINIPNSLINHIEENIISK